MGASGIEVSGENDLRKHLLAECYDNYYPLAPADRAEYERLAAERLAKGRGIMNGMELRELRGEKRGRLTAKRESLVKILSKKFGPLPVAAIAKLESLTPEQLDDLLLALLDASSIAELGLIEPS